jgi:hypothetical protein
MFDRTALRGFINTLTVNATNMTEAAAKAALVRTAEAARARVLSGTPAPSSHREVVDGTEGAALSSVKADGRIVFTWQYLGEVVARVHELVVSSSPHDTGAYIAGIVALADGTQVDPTAVPPGAAQVHIVASVPYARRLEVGSPFVLQVPYQNMEHLATVAHRLYNTLAAISFVYVELTDGYELRGASGRRRRRGRTSGAMLYPAILIEPRSA